MPRKLHYLINASILAVALSTLSGCFERQYYGGGPGYGYQPGYYPPAYTYAPPPGPAYRYDGGGRAWADHERHEGHEEHEHHEHHDRD